MKTPLVPISILSIYKSKQTGNRLLLPERMAKCTPDTFRAINAIKMELESKGGKLILSDLFRSHDMQLQANLDFLSGRKPDFSPPPGGSMHEAGRALDLDLDSLKISLADFWKIADKSGFVPIISKPNSKASEAWHFDCRGSHDIVYRYYEKLKDANMGPYKAMSASGILSLGIKVDRFGDNQKEAFLQSCLVRLGKQIGNIDGIIGRNTRMALESLGIDTTLNTDQILIQVEDLVQKKFPAEFSDVPVDSIV